MNPESQVVLVVDDDGFLLRSAQAILQRGGYYPIAACGPFEALDMAGDFQGEIHLLLTDIIMPQMNGITLAEQIISERPSIRVLLMTGYSTAANGLPLLKKPFRMEQLLDKVREVLDGPVPAAIR
jgi:DNA-binding NtrC family response regulator